MMPVMITGKELVTRIQQIPRSPLDLPGFKSFPNHSVLHWPEGEKLTSHATRVFVTGHIIDKPTMVPRFPDNTIAIDAAAEKIHTKLDEIYSRADSDKKKLELVFCSGAAGMDLLALEWAVAKITTAKQAGEEPAIAIRVFLPYSVEAFREHSVNYGEHAQRWTDTFDYLRDNGLLVEPEFRRKRVRRQYADLSVANVEGEIKKRYGDHPDHYKEFDELNNTMVGMLRKGDYVLALWDGNESVGRGGTLDAIAKAYKRVGDPNHIMFVEDSERTIFAQEPKAPISIEGALAMRKVGQHQRRGKRLR